MGGREREGDGKRSPIDSYLAIKIYPDSARLGQETREFETHALMALHQR